MVELCDFWFWFWSCSKPGLSLAQAVTSNLTFPWQGSAFPWVGFHPGRFSHERETNHNGSFVKSSSNLESLLSSLKAVLVLDWELLLFRLDLPGSLPEQSADGVEDSLNRAQASLPLHKQSVGRWTPGRCDVGEERKYFWSLKEKLETTFKAKKSEAWICRSPHRVHRL